MSDFIIVLLAVTAASILGWRSCMVLVVERLRDELDAAVADNSTLMEQKAAMLAHGRAAGRAALTLDQRDAQAVELRRALRGGAR